MSLTEKMWENDHKRIHVEHCRGQIHLHEPKTLLKEVRETFDLNKSPTTSVNNTRAESGMVNNKCMMNIFPHFWEKQV